MFTNLALHPQVVDVLTCRDDDGHLLLDVLLIPLDEDVRQMAQEYKPAATLVWQMLDDPSERTQYPPALVQIVQDKYGFDPQKVRVRPGIPKFLRKMTLLRDDPDNQVKQLEALAAGLEQMLVSTTSNLGAAIYSACQPGGLSLQAKPEDDPVASIHEARETLRRMTVGQ